MEAVLKRLCEAEPDLERFTKQVVITDEIRQRFEAKIEVGDVEVDERYKNAYICKFYIEGRDEYYISASIKKQKEKRTGFIFEVRNGKGEACEYFQKHGPENIQMSIVQNASCKNENELREMENNIVESLRTDPKSMRVNLSRRTTAKYNKFSSGKIYIVWHKNCSQIHLASTVKSLAEKKGSFCVSENRGQKSCLFEIAKIHGGIKNFEFTLLEDFPCNCLAELERRQELWMNVFPKQLQIGEVIPVDFPIYKSISTFLNNVDNQLKKYIVNIVYSESMNKQFLNKLNVDDLEADARYKEAYIYTLRIEGRPERYYGSSIKRPADKRLSHIYDAAKNESGRCYEFFRKHGVQNIILDIVEYYPCENELELRLKENEYILQYLGKPECLNSQLAIKCGKKVVNRYKLGKIYTMVCDNCPKLYLGSTIQALDKRRLSHVSKAKAEAKSRCNSNFYKTAKLYGGVENFKIVLLEDWPCNSKRELEDREQFWKDVLSAVLVNQNNPKSSPESKKAKRKISNAAYVQSDQYESRRIERQINETAAQRIIRLARARARSKTEGSKQQQRNRAAFKRQSETSEQRLQRLKQLRSYSKSRDQTQKDVKNAKRLLVRLNAREAFIPQMTTINKYGIYKADTQYKSRLLEQSI